VTHWASDFYTSKPVLVVGGTSGIGLAIATAFRDAGAHSFVPQHIVKRCALRQSRQRAARL